MESTNRDPVIDSARGIAILVMVWVHAAPRLGEGVLGSVAWGALWLAFGFALLAGMTTAWVLKKRERARKKLFVRGALLIVLGGVLQEVARHAPSFEIPVVLHTLGALLILSAVVGPIPQRQVLFGIMGAFFVASLGCFFLAIFFGCVCVCDTPPGVIDPLSAGASGVVEAAFGLVSKGFYPLVVWIIPFLIGVAISEVRLGETYERLRLFIFGGVLVLLGLGFEWLAGQMGWPISVGDARLVPWELSVFRASVSTMVVMCGLALMIPFVYWPLYSLFRLDRFVLVGQAALAVYIFHLLVLWVWPEFLYEHTVVGWASAFIIVILSAYFGKFWAGVSLRMKNIKNSQ
ncbi:heparan-alpha-glucosaminide N-acetyltransferase domain-containing protein [Halorhodospira sp. 9622]|uniref:heparan-alpha-glucosaminide N-acetyltransferase domain-containing protein n=1 Tax=Halorhodospira sp. 9622 TaxID=2899136 RepID=UPI001EE8E66C|nr:heparan-alpha-glucosaminide N-acetyltransferase domain-containing protein [Halorhodospira sp. 9622]